MSEEKDKCDTCEHRGDSSNEYCGSCGGGVESNWKEAGWSKDKTINELRTRVAELEAEAKMGNIPYKEAVKLRTRVAELEQRMIDQANMICKKSNEADMERRTAEMHCADAVKLSKRVEELEKENGNILKDFEELRMKSLANEELQTRLSTLLKASEGMEKALEQFQEVGDKIEHYDNGHECRVTTHAPTLKDNPEVFERCKVALADFRAVKETMEKGAGK